MSHFYGTLQGSRGQASRCGTKKEGMETYTASWEGAIRCRSYINDKGEDCVKIDQVLWQGKGTQKVLYDGLIGKVRE